MYICLDVIFKIKFLITFQTYKLIEIISLTVVQRFNVTEKVLKYDVTLLILEN